jgi:hypothetical protein
MSGTNSKTVLRPRVSDRVQITPDGLLSTTHRSAAGAEMRFPSTRIVSLSGSTT